MTKEFIDQPLHVALGISLVMLLAFPVHLYISVPIALALLLIREILQRLRAGMKWWDCRGGCRLDLVFGSLGILIGAVIVRMTNG